MFSERAFLEGKSIFYEMVVNDGKQLIWNAIKPILSLPIFRAIQNNITYSIVFLNKCQLGRNFNSGRRICSDCIRLKKKHKHKKCN